VPSYQDGKLDFVNIDQHGAKFEILNIFLGIGAVIYNFKTKFIDPQLSQLFKIYEFTIFSDRHFMKDG
jgi:hypothetical protein